MQITLLFLSSPPRQSNVEGYLRLEVNITTPREHLLERVLGNMRRFSLVELCLVRFWQNRDFLGKDILHGNLVKKISF
jgi:hypothetical protein